MIEHNGLLRVFSFTQCMPIHENLSLADVPRWPETRFRQTINAVAARSAPLSSCWIVPSVTIV